MLSNILKLNFHFLKITRLLRSRYQPKILRDILKKYNKEVCVNEVILLMTMKRRQKMENRSQRYNIIRPRPTHGHKYTKYKLCLGIMMVLRRRGFRYNYRNHQIRKQVTLFNI